MQTVLAMLRSWILVNWKTTAMGIIGAVEIYQQTHNVQLALTAFVTGLFMSDAKTAHATQPSALLAKPGGSIHSVALVYLAIAVAALGSFLCGQPWIGLMLAVVLVAAVFFFRARTAVLIIVVAGLSVGTSARADDVQPPPGFLPQIAICNAGNTVCLAPAVAIVPYTIDLGTGNIGPAVLFQGGQGITFVGGKVSYGADALFGTSTSGGWNAALMGKVGPTGAPSFHLGPVIVHTPGDTRFTIGIGAGY